MQEEVMLLLKNKTKHGDRAQVGDKFHSMSPEIFIAC